MSAGSVAATAAAAFVVTCAATAAVVAFFVAIVTWTAAAAAAESLIVFSDAWARWRCCGVLYGSSKPTPLHALMSADAAWKLTAVEPPSAAAVAVRGRGTGRDGQGPFPWRLQREHVHCLAKSSKRALAVPQAVEAKVMSRTRSVRQQRSGQKGLRSCDEIASTPRVLLLSDLSAGDMTSYDTFTQGPGCVRQTRAANYFS